MPAGAATKGRAEAAEALPALLEVRGVCKSYPGVVALAGVDLDIRAGEVHAVLGGNGAGKSTLAKVIGGVEPFDQGEIRFDGTSVDGRGPGGVAALGIALIHQKLQLFPPLSVAENLNWLVHGYPTRAGLTAPARTRRQAEEILEVLGERSISPDAPVETLRPAESWLLSIAAALYREPRLLILDESTAALPEADAQVLFEFLRERRDAGLAVMLVTHRLEEVRQIADRVTVLRDGRFSGRTEGGASTHQLVSLMFGDELATELEEVTKEVRGEPTGEVLVAFEDVTAGSLRNFDLTIRRGEIVGIAGALGSGRTQIVRTLLGDAAVEDGRILFKGEEHIPSGPADSIGRGIAVVAEDRDTTGLLHGLNVARNITITGLRRARQARTPVLSLRRERKLAGDSIETLAIKGRPTQQISTLSGGNQQKTLIARALLLEGDLLVLDEPSAGVDIATRLELRAVLHQLAEQGRSVLVISSEFDDLVRDCTRIAVIREGAIVAESAPFDTTHLAHLAYGGAPT
jgi:ribose transport system ATP-binding protein